MPDYVDSTTTELQRKVATLKIGALIETVSYLILLGFWLSGNRVGTRIFGSAHGMVFLAFAAMVLSVRREMGWAWNYVALAIVLGPAGSLLVYARIKREGVPIPDWLRGGDSNSRPSA